MTINNTKHEMVDALNFLDPRIHGIEDIQKYGGSSQLKSFLSAKLYDFTKRRALCFVLLSAIESLLADGYPEIPDMPITVELYGELTKQIEKAEAMHRQEITDIEFVRTIFTPVPKQATDIAINLGEPVDNPR